MLEPDRGQLEGFVDALFRHAGKDGFVSLRAFHEDDSAKPFRISPTSLAGGLKFLLDVAEDDARRAANTPKSVVFCPPLATFTNKERAREQDIAQGFALSVECDQRPREAAAILERLLGQPTMIVRSGGKWTDPASGQIYDKLHLHWRLTVPARGESLRKLKQARDLAARLVGGDPSNKPVCHPIRWPGSWHRKAEPVLCETEEAHPDQEIDLDTALAALVATSPAAAEKPKHNGQDHGEPTDWTSPVQGIINGTDFHNATVVLAAKFLAAGMSDGAAVNAIRALMESSTGPHDGRWATRYADIPRAVTTAREKIGQPANRDSQAGGADAQGVQGTLPGLGEWDAGEVDDDNIPPRGWLLGNVFCRGFVSSILGDGGVGKTATRYAQLLSLACGRSLTGEHVFQRSRVMMISLEDEDKELRRRIRAARLHHGVEREELKGWLFVAAPGLKAGKLLTAGKDGQLVTAGLADKIEKIVTERRIDIVSLDPFVKAHAVGENDNNAIDAVVQILTEMAVEHNIAVDVPHHISKGLADPGNANRGRGASAMKDAARLVYTLTPMSPEEGRCFGLDETLRRHLIRMDSGKVNIAPPMTEAKWFRLVGIALGNATEMYPAGDTVQTVEPWTPPDKWEGLSHQVLNQILTDIDAGTPDGGRYSDMRNVTPDRSAWRVIVKHAPTKAEAQAREIIKAWVKAGLLVRDNYENPTTRKTVKGLRVDNTKRPS
jgi:RecA-family ATPase